MFITWSRGSEANSRIFKCLNRVTVSFCYELLSTECDSCLSWNNIYNFFFGRLNGYLEIICDFLDKESELLLLVKRY